MSQTFEEKIKAKIEALKNPPKFQSSPRKLWTPKADTQTDVRLLRYPHQDPEEPFIEMWLHYNLGNPPIVCPQKTKGGNCPVCAASDKLYKKRNNEDYKASKQLRPTQRFYAVVVDRNDSSHTPKFWGFGTEIYMELLEKLVDRDFKVFLDPVKGYDLTVTSKKIKDRNFPKTSIQFRPVQARLADTDKKIQQVVESVPKIETVFEMLSEEDIKQRLNDFWQTADQAPANTDSQNTAVVQNVGTYSGPASELDVDSAFEKALDD